MESAAVFLALSVSLCCCTLHHIVTVSQVSDCTLRKWRLDFMTTFIFCNGPADSIESGNW